LGAIITLAIQGQAVGQAMFLLFVYSMGLAIPFLISAWVLTTATNRLRFITRHMATIERVSGAFLILIGVLLLTNTFARLNIFFNRFVPEWLIQYI
jgi:cytochrome c-type biogenesis protein